MSRTFRLPACESSALVLAALLGQPLPGWAADCPTVADAKGLTTAFPEQAEAEEAVGLALAYTENPMFDAEVTAGKLAPVAERLPAQPLIVLPYDDCGSYGGTIRGTSRAPTSGTSDILSWRQAVLVRMSDDLQTIVPNVARSWKWNDDFTQVIFELRKGHKWSDGEPFTADDVVFFFITHDLGIVAQMADRVAIMYAGRIVETGAVREIFRRPAHPYTRALIEAVPRLGDLEHGRRIRPIAGAMPSIFEPPAGCRFHPRCPVAELPRCAAALPPVAREGGHEVACIHGLGPGLAEVVA